MFLFEFTGEILNWIQGLFATVQMSVKTLSSQMLWEKGDNSIHFIGSDRLQYCSIM